MSKQRILDTRTIAYNNGYAAGTRDRYNYANAESVSWAIAVAVANCEPHYAAGYHDGLTG
jgi:hypothetical protein